MESGVKILLERIKTNPEEFTERRNRWMNTILTYRDFMNAEDRVALDDALRPVLMEKFNEEILNTLMAEKEDFNPFGKTETRSFGTKNYGATITVQKKTP
jgi:hypothetical protein